ncbi:MAG: FxsA family protein [Sulfuriferula sp.]
MRFLIGFIIVLSFPAMEIYTLVKVYQSIGWWVIALLLASVFVGVTLIAEERLAFIGRMMMTVQSGGSPIRALFESGRTMIAGGLFIFPGVISDVMAVLILLIPARLFGRKAAMSQPVDDDVIEGEYRREDNARLK